MYRKEKNGKNLIKIINQEGTMNISDMKNIVVLKNLPSNLVEEAIVVLKENKKIHKYQLIDAKEKNNDNIEKNNDKGYILKEAEMLVKSYTEELEKQSPKWKKNMKKLEKRYKNSIKLNFFLFFTTILSIIISLI